MDEQMIKNMSPVGTGDNVCSLSLANGHIFEFCSILLLNT